MADDPYVTGPKSRAERKAKADTKADDDAPKPEKLKRKWYDIVTDAIVPQKRLIEGAARKVDKATGR